MTKKKKLVKEALKSPELFSSGELNFFERWLLEKKRVKQLKKSLKGEKSEEFTDPV